MAPPPDLVAAVRRRPPGEVPIVFTHVPKTGGTTLTRHVLAPALGLDDIPQLHSVKKVAAELARPETRVVSAHVPYGAHFLALRHADYVITLREPLERSLSHFEFAVALHRRRGRPESTEPDPIGFHQLPRHRNLQTVFAAGWMGERLNVDIPRRLEECVLGLARRNLDRRYRWVGFVETLEHSARDLAAEFGWTPRSLEALNVNEGRRRLRDLVDEERDAIEGANHLDRRLYDWAVKRFGP